MESTPSPNEAPERARELARRGSPRVADADTGRRRTAYTPKPDFDEDASAGQRKPAPRRWGRWVAIGAAVALLGSGGWALQHALVPSTPADHALVLTEADIDQAATAEARAMLARGEIPPSLVHASDETRREVADGRQSLYTKQLLPPEPPKDFVIHVTVSEAGAVVGEDLLTPAHRRGTTFPSRTGAPLHFHFAVESAGANGTVTCWLESTRNGTVHTAPMPTGGSGDLEARTR